MFLREPQPGLMKMLLVRQALQVFVLTLPLGPLGESGWADENAVGAASFASLSAHSPLGESGSQARRGQTGFATVVTRNTK